MIISGKIGEVVRVTGDNFSIVTRVDLSSASCSFEILNKNLMDIVIPEDGASAFPVFYSDYSNSHYTGTDKIAVFPRISTLNTNIGMYLDTVMVTGNYFSGVTGVRLNNTECPFSVLSNTQINFTVPHGDSRGSVRMQTDTGLELASNFKFFPEITVSGSSASSAFTGQSILLSGQYFFPELMLQVGSGYLVSFRGVSATGVFRRIDDFTLEGLVPTGAVSGRVLIAKNPLISGVTEYYSS